MGGGAGCCGRCGNSMKLPEKVRSRAASSPAARVWVKNPNGEDKRTPALTAALFTATTVRKQPAGLSAGEWVKGKCACVQRDITQQ